ncbi:MAG: hypothetical protein ZNDK_0868 [Candidatus Desulfovibrio kirbyi]|jgi:hypothetical protein|uniref:Uncharacterized protein n=1 Tax=Candidatus Desulfovibrio kirbyi TaxID=2696086 RepID=A0A6L2R6E1_9BACT|nr:hypothetical protein [Desulfovibrio sp.]GFH63097.1 MAG: hypothetical protein ZNDK_0868 [Candidatus Desulfovibrio kirbyi]
MSHKPILKVYGNISPVSEDFFTELAAVCARALPASRAVPVLSRDGDTAGISFEGIWFPVEELLKTLSRCVTQAHTGRLDVLDMENWRLDRCVIAQGTLCASSAPLNNVLEFSGL